jgi:hypothetical protein
MRRAVQTQKHRLTKAEMEPGMTDKLLTCFANVWIAFAGVLAVIDIGSIIVAAPTVWSGIWAAQEKWFDPFNVMHFTAEIIFVSPAIGAILLRDKLRGRRGNS